MGSKMPKIGARMVKPTRLVYCRYLLYDPINYTTTISLTTGGTQPY